jgi:hypothetical protein
MSVVVSDTDVRKPMKARAKEGVLVSMVVSPFPAPIARACFRPVSSFVTIDGNHGFRRLADDA